MVRTGHATFAERYQLKCFRFVVSVTLLNWNLLLVSSDFITIRMELLLHRIEFVVMKFAWKHGLFELAKQ